MRHPNLSKSQQLFYRNGQVEDIVANWNKDTNPFEQVVVPFDGMLTVNGHVENHAPIEMVTDQYYQTAITVFHNNLIVIDANASTATYQNHVESSDTNTFPVRKGDIIKWGSQGSAGPNGRFNYVRGWVLPWIS